MKFSINQIKDIVKEKLSQNVKSIFETTDGVDQYVWIIDTDTQKIVFKQPKNDNKVRNTREVIACKLLAKIDIIVPQILFVDDEILIETFVEGTQVDKVDFSKVNRSDLYFRAGEVLKRMHSIKTTNFGMVSDETLVGEFSSQLDYLQDGSSDVLLDLEELPFYSKKDVELVIQYFESNKSVIANSPSVLLHMDYCDSNLIYTPEGDIAVIDFADLSVGNPMLDVTKMYMDHFGDGAFQALIDGYGTINFEQIKLLAIGWFSWLITALWKKNNSHERVKQLRQVFESIWK
jgi:aminoglycoside phosphotransferase (APT) family kinase protein